MTAHLLLILSFASTLIANTLFTMNSTPLLHNMLASYY